MTVARLGSEGGGWHVDVDAVPEGSVVLDCGIGRDDSFSRELIRLRNVRVIAIDPSLATKELYAAGVPKGIDYLPFAVTKHGLPAVFSCGDNRSDSAKALEMPGMTAETYTAPGVSLRRLIGAYLVSLVKLDIEGGEFRVLDQCLGVRQVLVEFHLTQLPNRRADAVELLDLFRDYGYEVIHQTKLHEYTLLLKGDLP